MQQQLHVSGLQDGHLTLGADLTRADEVALVAHEDDGSLRLSLSQEEPELSGAVETPPVGHREHQNTHLALKP